MLVDAFNDMLARVQSRDIEVQNARYSLQTTLNKYRRCGHFDRHQEYIVFANPAACSLLRLNRADLTGPVHR